MPLSTSRAAGPFTQMRPSRRADQCILRKITPADMPSAPMLNLPPWLRAALIADWEKDTAANIAAMMMQPPPLDLRPKHDSDLQELAETLGGIPTLHGSVRLNDGMVSSLTGYDEGRWWVQDSAASLPAILLGAEAGETVVDLCAAPGGKTAQLCAAGADVFAVDAAKQRMGRLKENMSRLGFNPQLITADGTRWQPPPCRQGADRCPAQRRVRSAAALISCVIRMRLISIASMRCNAIC